VFSNVLPVLPSRNVINWISKDLQQTYLQSSILKQLGGSLILNENNIFNSNTIFSDTSASTDTINLLNAVKALATSFNNKSLYTEVLSLIIDHSNIKTAVNSIINQRLSPIEVSLNYLNSSSSVLKLAGKYGSTNYSSQVLSNYIWDDYLGFSSMMLMVPIQGTTLTNLYSLNSFLKCLLK
jgi:hypothetical protein